MLRRAPVVVRRGPRARGAGGGGAGGGVKTLGAGRPGAARREADSPFPQSFSVPRSRRRQRRRCRRDCGPAGEASGGGSAEVTPRRPRPGEFAVVSVWSPRRGHERGHGPADRSAGGLRDVLPGRRACQARGPGPATMDHPEKNRGYRTDSGVRLSAAALARQTVIPPIIRPAFARPLLPPSPAPSGVAARALGGGLGCVGGRQPL